MSAATGVRSRPIPTVEAVVPLGRLDVRQAIVSTGLRVVVVRRTTPAPLQVRMSVPFGGQSMAHTAAAEVLAATLLHGPQGRIAADEALADLGGTAKAAVGPARLKVTASAAPRELGAMLGLLASALSDPVRDVDEFTQERDRVVHRVGLARTLPQFAARSALLARLYGDHPAARDVPDAAAVTALTPADVADLHADRLVPGGSVIVIVGDVDPARVIDEVETQLAAWAGTHPARALADPPPHRPGPVHVVARPGARQASARLATPGVDRGDPAHPAFAVAEHVLGGYFSSRLVRRLREELGYVYTVHTASEDHGRRPVSVTSFGCAPDKAGPAVAETIAELRRLAIEPPSPAEIDAARTHKRGIHAIGISTNHGLAESQYHLAALGLDPHWFTGHHDRMDRVSPDEVAAAAAHFAPDALATVLLTPQSVATRTSTDRSTS